MLRVFGLVAVGVWGIFSANFVFSQEEGGGGTETDLSVSVGVATPPGQSCIGGPDDYTYDSTGDNMTCAFHILFDNPTANAEPAKIEEYWENDNGPLTYPTPASVFTVPAYDEHSETKTVSQSANTTFTYYFVQIIGTYTAGPGPSTWDYAYWSAY